jgi:hypothetical protein
MQVIPLVAQQMAVALLQASAKPCAAGYQSRNISPTTPARTARH